MPEAEIHFVVCLEEDGVLIGLDCWEEETETPACAKAWLPPEPRTASAQLLLDGWSSSDLPGSS